MAVYVRRKISVRGVLLVAFIGFLLIKGFYFAKDVYSRYRGGWVMGAQGGALPVKIGTFYEVTSRCNDDGTFSAVYYLRIESGFPTTLDVTSAEYTLKLYFPPSVVDYLQLPSDLAVTGEGVVVAVDKIGVNQTRQYTFRLVVPPDSLDNTDVSIRAKLEVSEAGYYTGSRFEAVTTYIKQCESREARRGTVEEASSTPRLDFLEVGENQDKEQVAEAGEPSSSAGFKEILKAPPTKICGCYNRAPLFTCQEYKNIDIDVRCETYCKARGFEYGEAVRCRELEVIYGGL